MRLGCRSVGADVNQLATFIAAVKTSVLGEADISSLLRWAGTIKDLKVQGKPLELDAWAADGYLKDLNTATTWRLQSLIALALQSVHYLASPVQQDFARLIVLRTGQWGLDMRSELPSVSEFRRMLTTNAHAMLATASDFADELGDDYFAPLILDQRSPGLAAAANSTRWPPIW